MPRSTPSSGSRQGSAGRKAADAALSAALLIAVWKLGASAVGIEMILPAPERVAASFAELLRSERFRAALAATAGRGLAAFGLSMALGSALGLAMGVSRRFESLAWAPLTVIRATPVLAVILLALVWFPSGAVPVFSAVVMAAPIVAAELAAAARALDPKLVEMATIFGLNKRQVALELRLPAALPALSSAAKNALGLSWKVVVAGEVLSQPARALGTGMQNARVMLETAEVFAWAAAGVLLCALSDALFNAVGRRLSWPTA